MEMLRGNERLGISFRYSPKSIDLASERTTVRPWRYAETISFSTDRLSQSTEYWQYLLPCTEGDFGRIL
jgi:hypothetical protein